MVGSTINDSAADVICTNGARTALKHVHESPGGNPRFTAPFVIATTDPGHTMYTPALSRLGEDLHATWQDRGATISDLRGVYYNAGNQTWTGTPVIFNQDPAMSYTAEAFLSVVNGAVKGNYFY